MSKVKLNTADEAYTDGDVITLGSGKTVERYQRSELTDNELADIRSSKGKLAARKICSLVKNIDRRVKNLLANPDQSLTDDERKVLANFLIGNVNSATDKLEGVQAEDSNLPF